MRIVAVTAAILALCVGAEAQIADFTPQTPLIGALLHNDAAGARRLLERGADPNEGRFVGLSPVLLAVIRQDVELVRLMVAKGADLTVRDRSGSTALMWAAFNDAGEAGMVEELLTRGADPGAVNNTGETALTWALRRGETPAVAALRMAGASDTLREKAAVQKALSLLQRTGAQFRQASGCQSCHHNALPQMAIGIGRSRGLAIDEPAARQDVEATVGMLRSVAGEALANRDRIPDPPISISYALLGLAAEGHPADEVTDAMARVVAAWQGDDGGFHSLPAMRPPIESSDITASALSLRALQLYGAGTAEQVARAADWLRDATPRTTEEQAMQLLGLAWAGDSGHDVRRSAAALLALQRPDGGWGQLPGLETDAYATGQALVALQAAEHPVSSAEYQRGVAFLLRTQFADGSWLVRTRTFPVQPPKDSGFPHGKHQWISAAGTSWAAMALALTRSANMEAASDGRVITRRRD